MKFFSIREELSAITIQICECNNGNSEQKVIGNETVAAITNIIAISYMVAII